MIKANLIKLRDTIIAHKENFNWTTFIRNNNNNWNPRYSELLESCGTVGCIQGFSWAIFGEPLSTSLDTSYEQRMALTYASEYQDPITEKLIFKGFNWQEKTQEEQYEEAIRRLNYFIEHESE
jgi:hypothetical protein